jgi:hypothetical protein
LFEEEEERDKLALPTSVVPLVVAGVTLECNSTSHTPSYANLELIHLLPQFLLLISFGRVKQDGNGGDD